MIHQQQTHLRTLDKDKDSPETGKCVIPLLSLSQNHLSMLVAEYDLAYYEFLLTGNEENEPFLSVREYGLWDLSVGVDVRISSAMILATMNALENMWIASDESGASTSTS